MSFVLSAEQRMYSESMLRLVERDVQPVLDAHDADRPLPKAAMRGILQLLAAQGLTAARLPESEGGPGMSMVDFGLCFEQLPPALVFALLSQEVTVARVFAESSAELRARYLPDLIAVRKVTCTATTEPNAGSDPRSVETRARRAGDDWIVDGRKMWISNAGIADVANVTVSVGTDERGLSTLMRLLVDREESPFEARETPVLGIRQGHLGEMLFDACRVPAANAMGRAGDAARILTLTWNVNRPLIGMAAVGMAQRALDMAVAYAGSRSQFGKAIAGHQLVQERLVDIEEAIVTSRLLCLHALACIDSGDRANQISAMAKRYAVQACERAVSSAMHVHGAMGISTELGLEQAYRDIRMLPIPDGTYEILTLIAGRELTGIPAYRA